MLKSPPEGSPLRVPEEPPPSHVSFPPAATADENGIVYVGGDLEPGTVLAAYRAGMFPMRLSSGKLAWWSPNPRAIITPDRFHISRSLRRMSRRFMIKVNADFEAVINGCANRGENEYLWITAEVREAYMRLHQLGWAHSVEAWSIPTDDKASELVGGLYGLAIGGLFSGESMFHRVRDASKAALVALVELLCSDGRGGEGRIIDVQWLTPHMASLGAVEVQRDAYLAQLEQAKLLAIPVGFTSLPAH